ncbi:hypothetical protein [Pseudonocardia sp.]|uniref:hypothetical protein n=1 Tax=Pseudonocardia sp. TaxID=60912 RepID=UPI003D150846
MALTTAQQIVDDITEGDLGPDTKLASEREMLERFAVGDAQAHAPIHHPRLHRLPRGVRQAAPVARPGALTPRRPLPAVTVTPSTLQTCSGASPLSARRCASNALTITLYVTPGPRQPDAQTRVEERTDSGWERHYARGVAVALGWVTDARAMSPVVDGSAEPIPAADRARCRAERQRIGSSAGG